MESTLTLKLSDLLSQVGYFRGYGLGADKGDRAWTDRQELLLKQDVDSGLRRFYYPPPVPPATTPHNWSFLKPVATLDIADGEQSVALPDDFGGFEGEVTLSDSTSSSLVFASIPLVGIGTIHKAYAEFPEASGRPQMVALSPNKGTGTARSTRTDLWVFPETDADYTFQFQYYLLPAALTTAFPYYYGGMAHAETVLESCLLIAESRRDDVPLQACVHFGTFMAQLAASVHVDSRNKPQLLGYNGDRSDGSLRRGYLRNFPGVTVNGVLY